MRGHSLWQRLLALILVTISVALFAAPANAAAGTWNASNTTAGEASTYSYAGTTTQSAALQSLKGTVPAGTTSTGPKGVQFNGKGGISMPNATNQASNTMNSIFRIRMDDWTPTGGQMIASKWANSDGERGWAITVNSDGSITHRIGNTAGGVYPLITTPLGLTDGAIYWIKIFYRNNVPADKRYIDVYVSPDGVTWGSSIASGNQGTARNTNNGSSANVALGASVAGISADFLHGTIYSSRIEDSTTGVAMSTMEANDYSGTATSWVSNGYTWTSSTLNSVNGTRIGQDLVSVTATGIATGGRGYLTTGSNDWLYQLPVDQSLTSGTSIALSLGGFLNTPTPGTYSSVVTTLTAGAVIDTFNMNANTFVSPTGIPFAVDLAPLFSFTVAPRSNECSLQVGLANSTYIAPGSAVASDLGSFNPSTVRSSAYDLSVATNARTGSIVNVRGAQPSNNMRSATQQPFADSTSTPVISTPTFGYTVSNTHNGLNASWKALSDVSAEVAFSSTLGFTNQCIGQTLAVSQTTPPGSYSATVTFTAVPTF